MPNKSINALSEAFGLTPDQRRLLCRVLWVSAVTASLWYFRFGFAFLGLASPFALAADQQALNERMARLERNTTIATRITLAQEIRVQVRAWCAMTDPTVRDAIRRVIDQRQDEYAELSGGQRVPEPGCSS